MIKAEQLLKLLMVQEGILFGAGYLDSSSHMVAPYQELVAICNQPDMYVKGVACGNKFISDLLDRHNKIRTYVSPN